MARPCLPMALAGLPSSGKPFLWGLALVSLPLPLSAGHPASAPALCPCSLCGDACAQGPGACSRPLLPSGCFWKPGCACHEDRAPVGRAQPSPKHRAHRGVPTHIAVTPDRSPHSAFPPSAVFLVTLLKYTLCSKLPVASDHTHSGSQPPLGGLHGPSKAPVITLDWSPGRWALASGHCINVSLAQHVLSKISACPLPLSSGLCFPGHISKCNPPPLPPILQHPLLCSVFPQSTDYHLLCSRSHSFDFRYCSPTPNSFPTRIQLL